MKKEELNYYDCFISMAKFSIEIMQVLKELFDSYKFENVKEKEIKVHEKENEADKLQHKLLNYLIKDFVPPIDREDIIIIARRLDDVIDNIDEVSIDLDILMVSSLRADMNKYMDLLDKATNKLHELLINFKDMKNYENVKTLVVEINSLEEQGDKLFQDSIRNLYSYENDAKEVIKWSKIYNRLEDCFDSIEDVANSVDEAFMKNA